MLREVEKNLYRLASQWPKAAGPCADELAKQAESFILNESTRVKDLVNGVADRSLAIGEAIRDLEDLQREVAPALDRNKWFF